MGVTRGVLQLLLIAGFVTALRGDARPVPLAAGVAFRAVMPETVVWAWEEPEDLTSLDPTRVGVAYLAESLYLSEHVAVRMRRQALHVAPGAAMMAVVRLETASSTRHAEVGRFEDSLELRRTTADELAWVAIRPGTRALQVDFDATRSQRAFYKAVLTMLRAKMPAAMPLSITALVSWCGSDRPGEDWLGTLPIDEAVPMYFRMGTPRGMDSAAGKEAYRVRQPLCMGSVGVATDERWPGLAAARRLYLFSPRSWTRAQLAALAATPAAGLREEALR